MQVQLSQDISHLHNDWKTLHALVESQPDKYLFISNNKIEQAFVELEEDCLITSDVLFIPAGDDEFVVFLDNERMFVIPYTGVCAIVECGDSPKDQVVFEILYQNQKTRTFGPGLLEWISKTIKFLENDV